MGARKGDKYRVPGRPKYYVRARVRRIEYRNPTDRPVTFGEFSLVGNQPGGGWAKFTPPQEAIQVSLLIPEGGAPHEAMREWLIRREAQKREGKVAFDLEMIAPLWNFGPSSKIEKGDCGNLHLSGTRTVHWGRDIQRALRVWEQSDYRGRHPAKLLGILEPDQYLPFLVDYEEDPLPPKSRWLYVCFDLSRPLEEQFEEASNHCKQIKEYALLLAGKPSSRPGRHEVRRRVLVFTLRYSAKLSESEIAKKVFPNEDQTTALEKVKKDLKQVRRAIRKAFPPKPPVGGENKPPL